jgi:hypothetical protein
LPEPASKGHEHVLPAYVKAIEQYNECAAGKETLAAKIRANNNKAENKNKNEAASGGTP